MKPIFFTSPSAFRSWLKKRHKTETELIVGFYKVKTGKPSLTWSESVDQALCFGWIDGIRKSIDEESYSNRFTPRRSKSIWSAINIKKVEALTAAGLMLPEGLKAFALRNEHKASGYSHNHEVILLDIKYEQQFKKNKVGWTFFNAQAPSYKKVTIHWIMTAKQEKTRLSRLEKAISSSEQQKRMT